MGEELTPNSFYMRKPDGEMVKLNGIKAINTVITEPIDEPIAIEADWSRGDDSYTFACEVVKPMKGVQLISMLTGYPNKKHIGLALYAKKGRVRKKYRNRIHKFVGWEVKGYEYIGHK